ncbi:MAG: ribosomal RNA small subunit methyltransferase A [Deltaproteobacteria bacterium]|nr:ribosomal RNA small subunit methyltransferase A [Deltaproteobacteria bacterium]MBK8713110.1 ribosomal RNA small subunit methyltransferase A [Deltaproteobacteria bacterium]MBP7286688.1 ribosomal RNA small subunit methyltransferase A [Nannocystaceae bacterium]
MSFESPGAVLRRHGLWARKSWGQNFLHAPDVHAAIVAAAGARAGVRVIEIGAGVGSLTHGLLATGAEVWAIERDRDLCAVLRHEFAGAERLRLFEADAVRFDYASAADAEHPRPTIVGNLPYHLTGPLMFALLDHHATTGDWIVMVQREVAERIVAPPGSRTYGGLSVVLGRVRVLEWVTAVSPGAFLPPPKVDSAVIRLRPREQPLGEVASESGFRALVRAAFQQRRKTLANALSSLAGRPAAQRWCERTGIHPAIRPEKLAPAQFAALQRAREQDPPSPSSSDAGADDGAASDDDLAEQGS